MDGFGEKLMLRNGWYPACASSRLAARPVASRVLDQDIVLFRDEAGVAHALLDRCCHRGVKLSLGKCTRGCVACPYHGWEYEGGGSCVHVPSLAAGQEIPKSFAVRSFPCNEQDSYVWVWMGGSAPYPAQPDPLPAFDELSWTQGSMNYACSAMKVIENNLDWCHPAFTHEGTHAQWFVIQAHGFREYSIEVRTTPSGLIEFMPPANSAADDTGDPPIAIRFDLPCRIHLSGATPQGRFAILLHCVPTSATTCRLEWLTGRGGPHQILWSDEEPKVLAQDRIVETSQRWYEGDGVEFERSVEADYPTLLARKIVAMARLGEWLDKRESLPRRRLVNVRS